MREKHASQNTVASYLRDVTQFADYLNASSSEGQTIQFLAEPREGAKCRPL